MQGEKKKFNLKEFFNGILKKDVTDVYLRARKGISRKEKGLEKLANKKTYRLVLQKGWLKQNSNKILTCAVGVILVLTFIASYPAIKQAIIQKSINSMPVEIHAPVEMLSDVDKDRSGQYIEVPESSEELQEAYKFLEEKLQNDATNYEIDINKIDNIMGIYKIDLANKNISNDTALQFLINAGGKDFIFEYTALEEDFENGFDVDTSLNHTKTLLSLIQNLSNCYPSNIIEQDEQKIELSEKIKTITGKSAIIGDPLIFAENAVSNIYQIPVYQKDACTLFLIKESVLAENCEDINFDVIYELLSEYLDKNNDFFEEQEINVLNGTQEILDAVIAATSDEIELSI